MARARPRDELPHGRAAGIGRRLEWLFHAGVLMVQCGAIMPLLMRSSDPANVADVGEANPLSTVTNIVVLVGVLFLLLRHARTTFRYIPALWLILGLVGLALVSAAWSDYPGATIRRTASLGTTAIWGWYLAARFELKDVIRLFAQTFAFMALASLA